MRVLYVIDSLVPSGAERSLAAMAPLFVQRGVVLDVAYLKDDPGLQDEIREAGARLFPLAGAGGRAGWAFRCRRLIAERRPHLVHTTLFESDVAGRTAARTVGVPVVTSLVGINYGPEQRPVSQIRRAKLKLAQQADIATARFARRFHAISDHVAVTMAPRLRIPRDRIDVIPRGRDPAKLGTRDPERRTRVRHELGLDPSTPVVLAAARHERAKGLDVLLRAVPRVPGATFLIAGRPGSQTWNLEKLVSSLGTGSAVRFPGPRDDVPDLMCSADVFVAPSRWEGLGGVVLEAMALEVPIVATDLPAIREMVADDAALLVPRDDPDALGEAIGDALAGGLSAERRASAARRYFLERFTLDRVVDQVLSFYGAALH